MVIKKYNNNGHLSSSLDSVETAQDDERKFSVQGFAKAQVIYIPKDVVFLFGTLRNSGIIFVSDDP